MNRVEKLAAQLAQIQSELRTLQSQPQLAYSSLEDGAVNEYDENGQLVQVIGKQWDGTHVSASVSGPTPPTPTQPVVYPIIGGIKISWDGNFENGAVAPMDFARVEVHVSTDPNFTAEFASTLRSTFETPRGSEVGIYVAKGQEYYVKLVARALSGKPSEPSVMTGPIQPGAVTTGDLAFELEDFGGTTIYYGPDQPTAPVLGDLWLSEEPPVGGVTQYVTKRWDGSTWVEVKDQRVTEALLEAQAAQEAAQQAGFDALAAQQAATQASSDAAQAVADAAAASELATLAKNAADSKITAFRQSSAPATTDRTMGDIWIDSDDGKVYVWTGSWTLSDDQRIGTLVTDVSTVSGVVATKVTVFAQISAPATTNRTIGDIWIDTDDGNKTYVWNGAWTPRPWGPGSLDIAMGGYNRLANSSFEAVAADGVPTGWFKYSTPTVQTVDTTRAHPAFGTKSMKVDHTVAADAPGSSTAASRADVPTTPGAVETASVWVWVDTLHTSNAPFLYIQSVNSSGTATTVSGGVGADLSKRDQWQRLVLTRTMPADAVAVRVLTPYCAVQPGTRALAWFDNVQIESGNVVTAYSPKADEILPGTVSLSMVSFTAREIGSTTTYRQDSAPATGMVVGDFWMDSDDGDKLYRYETPGGWIEVSDQRIITAITNSTTALSTANGKSRIFVQDTEPTGLTADDVDDLWIDSDDGNKTYRWTGTAWEAKLWGAPAISASARDLGAITTYKQDSAPAAGMLLGDFWIDSDDGNKIYRYNGTIWEISRDADINTAITTAATAQATADGKVRIFAQTSPPAGLTVDDVGDTWIDTDDDNKIYVWTTEGTLERTNRVWNPDFAVNITSWQTSANATNFIKWSSSAQARFTATANGAARVRTNSLSTGNGVWPILVTPGETLKLYARVAPVTRLQKLRVMAYAEDAAGTIVANVVVGEITATTLNFNTVEGTWTVPAGATSMSIMIEAPEALAGDTFAFTNVMVAEAAGSRAYFDGDDSKVVWLGTPHLSQSRMWEPLSTTLAWQPKQLRSNALQPGSIVAKDVIATGTVSAALLEALLILTTEVIAGSPTGVHAVMSPTGFKGRGPDSEGTIRDRVRIGTDTGDYFAIPDPTDSSGEAMVASISEDGQGSFQTVSSIEDPIIAGRPLLGDNINFEPPVDHETSETGWLERLPRGIVAYGDYNGTLSTTSEIGIMELSWLAEPNRVYRIEVGHALINGTSTSRGFRIRHSGPAATGAWQNRVAPETKISESGVMGYSYIAGATSYLSASYIRVLRANPSGDTNTGGELVAGLNRILICLYGSGTESVSLGPYVFTATIEDIGQDIPNTRRITTGGGTTGGGGGVAPTKTYTKTYAATWTRSWQGDGGIRSDTTDAVQGYNAYNGDGTAAIGFHSSLATDLAGANVNKIEVYLYCNHAYYNAGGTARIGVHGSTSAPAGRPSTSVVQSVKFGKPQGKWFTLPSSTYAGFKSGANRGITLGPGGGTNREYYVRFNGYGASKYKPILRATYTK